MVSSSFLLWWEWIYRRLLQWVFGVGALEPRRKSRTLFPLGLRLFLILRTSGSDEGFAEKFGWLSRSCLGWMAMCERERGVRRFRQENKWTIAPEGERKQFKMNLRAKRGASSSGTTKRGLLASPELQCACRAAPLDGESWC